MSILLHRTPRYLKLYPRLSRPDRFGASTGKNRDGRLHLPRTLRSRPPLQVSKPVPTSQYIPSTNGRNCSEHSTRQVGPIVERGGYTAKRRPWPNCFDQTLPEIASEIEDTRESIVRLNQNREALGFNPSSAESSNYRRQLSTSNTLRFGAHFMDDARFVGVAGNHSLVGC